ncbi:hypothetical protein BV898_00013 [Hypsibius exemplaris]|uniref:Reverse transcriptase domain-containing protein n=1 Tax=Hypsibius exemplaris TaxID=2072580 RepID=A0A1W0XEG3_HYPEX|nr:hypothetical protein BV898_00013 [Hypsibius exemplaris]
MVPPPPHHRKVKLPPHQFSKILAATHHTFYVFLLADGSIDCFDCGRLSKGEGNLKKHLDSPSLSAALALRQANQTVHRIPKDARYTAAEDFIVILADCCSDVDAAWRRLLLLWCFQPTSFQAVRAYLMNDDETQVLLKLDFWNAFNTIHRDKLLTAVRPHIPQYYAFVWQMYRKLAELFFGDFRLHSASGVQQGDSPLDPLFCLVSKTMQSPLNAWYLEDSTLGSPAGTVMHDFETGRKIGLNLSKCECFVFGGCVADQEEATAVIQTTQPDITFPNHVELSLLGASLLSDGVLFAIGTKTTRLSVMSSGLNIFSGTPIPLPSQKSRRCPKVLYLLQCAPTKLGNFGYG